MKYLFAIATTLFLVSACSDSTSPLLSGCLDIGMKEQMQGMEESDRYSVGKGVEQGCNMVVQECEREPSGEMCIAFKKKFEIQD